MFAVRLTFSNCDSKINDTGITVTAIICVSTESPSTAIVGKGSTFNNFEKLKKKKKFPCF